MGHFGFCVWLLIRNPSYWDTIRNHYSNHIINYPLHITVQSGFTNKNDAFTFMNSYTMPSNILLSPWLRTDFCTIHDKPFHSLEIPVKIGDINNAHISLAYDIKNGFEDKSFKQSLDVNIKYPHYSNLLPNKYEDGLQLCVADARDENPALWKILE